MPPFSKVSLLRSRPSPTYYFNQDLWVWLEDWGRRFICELQVFVISRCSVQSLRSLYISFNPPSVTVFQYFSFWKLSPQCHHIVLLFNIYVTAIELLVMLQLLCDKLFILASLLPCFLASFLFSLTYWVMSVTQNYVSSLCIINHYKLLVYQTKWGFMCKKPWTDWALVHVIADKFNLSFVRGRELFFFF